MGYLLVTGHIEHDVARSDENPRELRMNWKQGTVTRDDSAGAVRHTRAYHVIDFLLLQSDGTWL